jgi:hypothetical protein
MIIIVNAIVGLLFWSCYDAEFDFWFCVFGFPNSHNSQVLMWISSAQICQFKQALIWPTSDLLIFLSVFVWNAGYQGQKEETWACSEDDWRLLLAGRFSC